MYNFNNTCMCSIYICTYLVIQFLLLNFFQHFHHLQVQYLFQNFVSHHQFFKEYLCLFTLNKILFKLVHQIKIMLHILHQENFKYIKIIIFTFTYLLQFLVEVDFPLQYSRVLLSLFCEIVSSLLYVPQGFFFSIIFSHTIPSISHDNRV